MLRVAFIEFQLAFRGTQGTIWQYAYYNEKILGNKSIIFTRSHPNIHIDDVNKDSINYFLNYFDVYYLNSEDIDGHMKLLNIDVAFVVLNGGLPDNTKIPMKIPTITHMIFKNQNRIGTINTAISNYVSKDQIEVLPNIIEVDETTETLHEELNIPKNAIIFGRYGGYKTFDIDYVKNIIKNVATNFEDIYFIFMHTERFCDENIKNVIFLPGTRDIKRKTKFINTCDAMIHARKDGETFGMSCGEFATKGVPVLTSMSGDTAHIQLLGESAIIYDENTLEYLLTNFKVCKKYKHNYHGYDIATNINKFKYLLNNSIKLY